MKATISDYPNFSLRNLLTILFKRQGSIFFSLFVFAALGVAASLWTDPVYRASTTLLMEKNFETEKAILFQMGSPRDDGTFDWMKSEIRIMESYPVLAKVGESLGLIDESSGKSSKIANPCFAEDVKGLGAGLTITPGRNTGILDVSYECATPETALEVVEEVVDAYVSHRAEISKRTQAYKFFEKQLEVTGEKLKELEEKRFAFKQDEEVLSPDEQKNMLLKSLSDYQQTLTKVRTQRIKKEAVLAVIQKQIADGQEISVPSTEASDKPSRGAHIAKLKGDLMTLELRYDGLKQTYSPRYPETQKIKTQIEAIEKQIATEVREIVQNENASILALIAEEKELARSVSEAKAEIQQYAGKEYEYNQLSRGISDTEEIYSMLLKQREEARLSMAKLEQEVKVKVVSPARAEADPIKPKKALYIIAAVILGACIGIGCALVFEFLDHSIKTPQELEELTGLVALGAVQPLDISIANTKP